MKFKDIVKLINFNLYEIIIENHWTSITYSWVPDDTEVLRIIPIDEKTLKISVSIDADTEARICNF